GCRAGARHGRRAARRCDRARPPRGAAVLHGHRGVARLGGGAALDPPAPVAARGLVAPAPAADERPARPAAARAPGLVAPRGAPAAPRAPHGVAPSVALLRPGRARRRVTARARAAARPARRQDLGG